MKTMFKLSIILAAYTVVACVGLAVVYNVTSPLIAASAAREVKAALAEVYPDATDFEDMTGKVESGSKTIVFNRVYIARSGAKVLGLVVQVTGPTYASSTLLVGVDMGRKIKSVKFMSISDTPGLGTKATDESFKGQFTGKPIDDQFKVGKKDSGADVIAISGATITSKGVTNILRLTASVSGTYLVDNFSAPTEDLVRN